MSDSFSERQHAFLLRRLKILHVIAIIGLGTYVAADVRALGWQGEALRWRGISIGTVVVVLALLHTRLLRGRLPLAFLISTCVASFSTISVASLQATLGVSHPAAVFYAITDGFTLVFIGAAVTVPGMLGAHILLQCLTVGYLCLCFPDLLRAATEDQQLVWGMTNVLWVCIVCDISIMLFTRLQERELEARRELEQAAERRKPYMDSLVALSGARGSSETILRQGLDELLRLLDARRAFLIRQADDEEELLLGCDASGSELLPEPQVVEWLRGVRSLAAPTRLSVQVGEERFDTVVVPLYAGGRRTGTILVELPPESGPLFAIDQDFIAVVGTLLARA